MVFTWSSLAFSFPTSIYAPLKVEKKVEKNEMHAPNTKIFLYIGLKDFIYIYIKN
jgi:hypothetical protein